MGNDSSTYNNTISIFLIPLQRELVDMLTEKEVRVAKLAFSHMDVNKDGKVTELEAKKAFSDYFGQVNMNDR